MAKSPSFAGSPKRTATSAPFGIDAGPGDHLISCGVAILCSSAARSGDAKAAPTTARDTAEIVTFMTDLPIAPNCQHSGNHILRRGVDLAQFRNRRRRVPTAIPP